jgi:hypothetical protein
MAAAVDSMKKSRLGKGAVARAGGRFLLGGLGSYQPTFFKKSLAKWRRMKYNYACEYKGQTQKQPLLFVAWHGAWCAQTILAQLGPRRAYGAAGLRTDGLALLPAQ